MSAVLSLPVQSQAYHMNEEKGSWRCRLLKDTHRCHVLGVVREFTERMY
jgi:hypothetical protein